MFLVLLPCRPVRVYYIQTINVNVWLLVPENVKPLGKNEREEKSSNGTEMINRALHGLGIYYRRPKPCHKYYNYFSNSKSRK